MTHSEIVAALSQRSGLSEQQAKAFLQAQAELAYEQVRAGYPIAGIGIFTLGERPERKLVMQFGPKKGQTVLVPAARKLTLWVAKAAMDVVLKNRPALADVTQEQVVFPSDETSDEN